MILNMLLSGLLALIIFALLDFRLGRKKLYAVLLNRKGIIVLVVSILLFVMPVGLIVLNLVWYLFQAEASSVVTQQTSSILRIFHQNSQNTEDFTLLVGRFFPRALGLYTRELLMSVTIVVLFSATWRVLDLLESIFQRLGILGTARAWAVSAVQACTRLVKAGVHQIRKGLAREEYTHDTSVGDEILPSIIVESEQLDVLRRLEEAVGQEGTRVYSEEMVSDKPQSEILTYFKEEELREIVRMLRLDLPSKAEGAPELQRVLEERLVGISVINQQLEDSTIDGEIILGVKQVLLERQIGLPLVYREKLLLHGRRILHSMKREEDRQILWGALILIYYFKRDVVGEMSEIEERMGS